MGEKWRLFLWAPRGPCHLASGTAVGWQCLLGTRVQTLATCWPFVQELSQRPGVSLSPASHSGSAFCRKPDCAMPLRSLLISAPPVLPPRTGSAPVSAAFLLDVFLREAGSRCGKGAKQRGIWTPSLMFSPRSLTLSEPPSPQL